MRIPACLLVAAGAALAQEAATTVRLRPASNADARPAVVAPRIPLRLERPGDRKGLPADLTRLARVATLRTAGGGLRTLLFRERLGTDILGLLLVDADGDGALDDEEPHRAAPPYRAAPGVDWLDFRDVRVASARWTVRLVYEEGDLARALYFSSAHRRGSAHLSGEPRLVILLDADADGRYDGSADRWIALRAERASRIRVLRPHETFLLGEPQIPFREDGLALVAREVAADGSGLVLAVAEPPVPEDRVLARRYREVRRDHFDRFAREEPEFRKRWRLDPERPRVAKPAGWRRTTLSRAKELAAREGKPLLALYFAESNAWCYRLDYYTFPDRAVDELLRRFVLVRIDAAKDPEQSFRRTGARTLPALLPLTSGGEPVTFRMKSFERDGTTREIPAQRVIVGWQRPQELEANLRRILDAAR